MPRKRPAASAVREPLAWALGTPAKVAVLRALCGTGEPLTQRDLARRAGVLHRSVQLALDELVDLGLVTRRIGGRDYLVTLNDAHRMADPLRALILREAGHYLELRQGLASVAASVPKRAGLVAAALFGSAARGTDTPASDVDLLLIASDEAGLATALEAFRVAASGLRTTLGCRLSTVGYTRADAARRWRARSTPFNEIRRDAQSVFGPGLDEALGGAN